MKTLAAFNLGNYGIFWKPVLNSVPENASVSMDICRGGAIEPYIKKTIYFDICHVHVAFEEDVRVVWLTADDLFFGNSFPNTGWRQLGQPYRGDGVTVHHTNPSQRTREEVEFDTFERAMSKAHIACIKAAEKKAA